ncbi:MAG: phasin family protein [Burkholderiaceae bacterium]
MQSGIMPVRGKAMITKTKAPAALAAPARKKTAGSPAKAREPAPTASEASASAPAAKVAKPSLLRAGLEALGNARDGVVQHQSRVFEAVLGLEPGQRWPTLGKKNSAGRQAAREAPELLKFEMIFDRRVAGALERLGMPSVDKLRALQSELGALEAEVRRLKAELRKR